MIEAETARRKEQEYNRDSWVRHSIRKLSEAIDREAAKGLNSLSVILHTIVIGAENLVEIGEMCILIEKELKMNGYRIHYSIDGELTISW